MRGGKSFSRFWLVAGALALTACAPAPAVPAAALHGGIHFSLDRQEEAMIEAVTAPTAQASLAPVENVGGAEAEIRPLRLFGRAVLPGDLTGAANVHDGQVTGSAVVVTDATNGRILGTAVSYYDGSFMVDIPLRASLMAALVSIELVDATDSTKTVRMMAPMVLKAGMTEENIVLTPGSTALVGFLTAIAAEQAGAIAPGEEISADPNEVGPGKVTQELGNLIAVFEPETRDRFAMLAESSPELKAIDSLGGFQSAIQKYVGRLTRAPRTKTK